MQSVLKHKWMVLAICLVVVILATWSTTNIRINPDIESYLPDQISSKINTDSIEQIFHKSDPLLLVYSYPDILDSSALERFYQVDSSLDVQVCFEEHQSLFTVKQIRSGEGMMIVEKLLDSPLYSVNNKSELRERIRSSRQSYGHLVAKDFSSALILLNPDSRFTDKAIIQKIDSITGSFPGVGQFYLYGPMYMRFEAGQKISRDFFVLLPLGLIIMLVFLFFSFRQKRAIFLPFAVVVISIMFCFGLMPLFGWELSIIGILLPVMMIAIANDYGIHFITKYQEISVTHQELPERQIVLLTVNYLKNPIILTGLTTMIGLAGMIFHIILPAKQMGLISSIGIAVAVLLSLVMIPALLVGLSKKSHRSGFLNHKNKIHGWLSKSGHFLVEKPKLLILIFSILFISLFTGFSGFKIASDFDTILHADHPYSKAKKLVDSDLGGTKNIRVLFRGDTRNPALLQRLDTYQYELEQMPEVGAAFSIATLIREMTKAMNEPGEPEYDRIPESRNSIAQYIELYNMSGDPADLEEFTDFNFEYGVLEVQFITNDTYNTKNMRQKLEAMFADDPAYCFMGGYCLIEDQMNHYVALGQLYSLLFALICIIVILSLVFRSLVAGLLGGLPLLVVVLATLGFMGYLGIELNIVTALISSISIGLGVDYTLHIFWRIKKETHKGSNLAKAIQKSMVTTAYGVTINALSVMIGFSVLLFSSFAIIREFSLLIVFSIGLCMLCALLLVPAICILTKPKFLTR